MSGIVTLCIQWMMGWVRSLISWFWQTMNGSSIPSALLWLQENGLKAALILLILGTAVDVIVRLCRWGTLKVYASFFRRLRGTDGKTEEPLPQEPQPEAAVLPGRAQPKADGSLLQRAVQTVKNSLADDDEIIRYQPARPAFDQKDVYHPPVMPSSRPVESEAAGQTVRRRRRNPNA